MKTINDIIADLADRRKWNWTEATSRRDAADKMLFLLAECGLIKCCMHPMGGWIWKHGKKLFGRTDGITTKKFDQLWKQQRDKT